MQEKKIFHGLLCLFFIAFWLTGCPGQVEPPPLPNAQYLFLAHLRSNDPTTQKVIPEVERIDLEPYDMLLLGGDLTPNTTADTSTLLYVDSLFDLGNPHTLLAPGNHEEDNFGLLTYFTRRPTFYTYHHQGITFLVLDTQRDNCSLLGPQLDMIRSVTDTLSGSEQLVILHHKLLWMPDHPTLKSQINQVANAGLCNYSYCLYSNNFYQDVYPLLVEVQQKGIPVLLIGGDVGFRVKYFEYLTPEGIWFLASGMKAGDTDNQGLVLEKDGVTRVLSWKSTPVSELVRP